MKFCLDIMPWFTSPNSTVELLTLGNTDVTVAWSSEVECWLRFKVADALPAPVSLSQQWVGIV
jgi:hypothetical protein